MGVRDMIIKECKSYDGNCPCLGCEKLIDCGPCLGNDEQFETNLLCDRAKEYCEGVNHYGRE